MPGFSRQALAASFFVLAMAPPAWPGEPKLDKETCEQLRGEQATFAKSGIAADFERGAPWAKANLSPERLREIEHYIMLDEQLKFGCRQATISIDAMRAGEAARLLELNPTADPTALQEPNTDSDGTGDAHGNAKPAASPEAGGADTPKPSGKRSHKPRPEKNSATTGPADTRAAKRPNDAYVPPATAETAPENKTTTGKP